MSITQQYTAIAGDVITAARWNNEFGNIYNNLVPLLQNYLPLNLKDNYSAIGDGTANDQSAVGTAVAAALSASRELYWPAGTYKTTGTIANFHSVVHRGPGILKRGSDLFYVDPTFHPGVTNRLYIATTGDDTNDGLSASQPRLTILATGNVIYNYQWSDITWQVKLAAGTYTAVNQTFDNPFPSSQRVQFLGVSVGAGVQPTVIVQATGQGAGTSVQGVTFRASVRAQVSDINFKSYRKSASPDGNELGSALVADGFCDLYTTNVWTDDCDQGIYCTNGTQARIQAGRHGYNAINGCGVQFIRHCKGTVGYNGSLADINGVTGTAFIGGQYGVQIQEFSMSHTDFCYYSAQTQAGVLINTGRVHSVSSTYDTCIVGIDCRSNGNLGSTTNTFTSCTNNMVLRSGARLLDTVISEALMFSPPLKEINAVSNSTQVTTPGVTILSRVFQANELAVRGTGFKWSGYFEVTGTAGTKTVTVVMGATTLLTATIAASTLEYKIIVEFINLTAASAQKCFTQIIQNGVLVTCALSQAIAEDLTASKTLTITHFVGNASDTNKFGWGELEIQH